MDIKQNEEMEHGEAGDKKKRKGKRGKQILQAFFLFTLAGSLLMFGRAELDAYRQRQNNTKLAELARQPVETEAPDTQDSAAEAIQKEEEPPYVSPINFEALREINPEIVAWITIPGTSIDYPVVQTDNNKTYLKKNFEGNRSFGGTIYLDCDSRSDFLGYHSILYGHHMRNDSMFSEIVNFREEEFFKKNREVILYLPDREFHLKTIAAVYGDDSGEKRRTIFEGEEHFRQYVDEMTKNCSFRELPEQGYITLYSFVTCSYEFRNARTILYAVREKTAE